MLIVGILFVIKSKESIGQLYDATVNDRGFAIASGYIALVLGLATVLLHNIWVADWRVVITVFGWLSLLKGVVRLGFPGVIGKITPFFRKRLALIRFLLVLAILASGWALISLY